MRATCNGFKRRWGAIFQQGGALHFETPSWEFVKGDTSRITSCGKLLLFESQAAVDSKYVRREVQFADSMNKPIIRVQLEAARLRHGMKFLLDPLQGLNPDAPDFLAQLDRALRLTS